VGSLSETARRFRVKFFERFGKLFFKKVFQGFDLALKFTALYGDIKTEARLL
jgi:hypothetical protein